MLVAFYKAHHPEIQSAYLREVVHHTQKWAARLCLTHEIDTILSMGHRESGFDPTADDIAITGPGKNSVGIYQTRKDYRPWLRAFWLKRGYRLGADDDVETQVAFGVAEFYVHLGRSGGNVWGAVRRYNGSGHRAQEHARKVFVSRRVIFKRPHYDGEAFVPGCKGAKP